MSDQDDREFDEQAAAREIKRRMRGLDPYIPPPPPFETVRPESRLEVAAGSGSRASSRLRPNFGVPVLLIGIALVAVLALGSAFRTTPAVAPSGTQSSAPSYSAPPSPTGPVVVVPTATPPLATASLPPGVIFSGPVQTVQWSPGGTRIAVTECASSCSPDVKILTPDGGTVETVNAMWFGWIDDKSYVAISAADPAVTFVGHVRSTARETITGRYTFPSVASSTGAVALAIEQVGSDRYVIWNAAGLSAPRDGVPVEFSPDGTMLAVVHYPRDCCAGVPSPEPSKAPGPTTLDIVRTDTGKSVRSTGDIVFAYGLPVSFSPDGRMVAFRRDTADGHEDLAVLDIGTGKVWVVQSGGLDILHQGTLAWLDSTHLDLRSAGPTGTEPAGFNLVVTHWPSDVATRSVSSRGYVATARTGSPQIEIQSGGKLVTRSLPGVFDGLQLLWSPDGSTLLVTCNSYNRSVPSQVVLLRP
jgi:hypothetical protein